MVTANRAIFAVTVTAMAKTDRRQNAVRIVLGGSSDGVLPSHCFAAFPEWRSCPYSAALSRSLPGEDRGGVSHSDGHSVVSKKRSRHIDAPTPAGVFLSLGFLCGCLCNRPLLFQYSIAYLVGPAIIGNCRITYGTVVCQYILKKIFTTCAMLVVSMKIFP